MRALPLFLLISVLLSALSARLMAQDVVLKDGNHINALDLVVGNGKITRNIVLSNGQKAQASVNFSDIDHLEWSEPQELQDARSLLSQGKTKEALAALDKGKAF